MILRRHEGHIVIGCTGLSAYIAILNSDFTSLKPTMLSNSPSLPPIRTEFMSAFVTMSMVYQLLHLFFSIRLKRIHCFLFSPFLSHHSLHELWIVLIFLVRTLSSFIYYHPLRKSNRNTCR